MAKVSQRTLITATLAILLACWSCAFALDSSLDLSQYAHTSWKIRDGFIKGKIAAITQTPDGYLWLGTTLGLFRFDGVRTLPWLALTSQQLPNDFIYALLVSGDGTMWIGTRNGLASWRDGKLTQYTELAGDSIYSLVEDHEGTVWATSELLGFSSAEYRLCAVQRGHVQCYGEDGTFKKGIGWVYEDSAGNLWVGGHHAELWRWKPGPPHQYDLSRSGSVIYRAIEDDGGGLLLATARGLTRFVAGEAQKYAPTDINFHFTPERLFRSSDGNLWVGTTDRGLIHIHSRSADWFTQNDGLSGNAIFSMFQDREGNVWVGTDGGLDRFREYAVPTISGTEGLGDSPAYAVVAAKDGSVWLASTSGVSRWKDGKAVVFSGLAGPDSRMRPSGSSPKGPQLVRSSGLPDTPDSLFEAADGQIWVTTRKGVVRWDGDRFVPLNGIPSSQVYAITQDLDKAVWISSRDEGLIRVSREGTVEKIPWSRLGEGSFAMAMAVDPSEGGLWLGFARGGIAYWKDGNVRASYSPADGLGNGLVKDLRFGSRGALWAATEGGLSRIQDGHITTLTSKNGLPCDTVHWMVEDNDRAFWLYMPCGLVRITRPDLDAWINDPNHTVQTTVYDISDGVRLEPSLGGYTPQVSKSRDGRIWFAGAEGVSIIDPHHLAFNKLPPPLHIEQIIADGKIYDAASQLHLPPLPHYLEIDYTALSLVAPEKGLFRYKLEGFDRDWQQAGTRRQAFYTNLPPRNYRFRVAACNNSGVWNEAGATLDFFIDPTYYQTAWFRALCVVVFLALLWSLYHLRRRQLQQQFNMRLETRVSERTRIARELHDTLLQSFHGLLFRFQAARNMLPGRPAEAGQALDGAITRAEQAIAEGRSAIQDLRSAAGARADLAQSLTAVGQELATRDGDHGSQHFQVIVEGVRRKLSPVFQEEIYRMGRELLQNAFRHAHAREIEAEIRYGHRMFHLLVRDDGTGIDPKVLEQGGRPGHWGLPGVRERAQQFGARLDFWSEAGAGTEIELTVPANIAYEKSRNDSGPRFWLFRKKEEA